MGGKKNQGEIKKCLNCGKEEYIPPYRLSSHKFCSRSCAYEWKSKNERLHMNCVTCGNIFSFPKAREKTAKYCSDPCRYKAMVGRGSVQYKCQHCDKTFLSSPSTNRKYCSKACVNKANKSVFKPKFSTVRKAMIARGMLTKCERCGFDAIPEILGVHHKDRNRKNNDLSNLEVLCPNCHSTEHMKHTPHGFKE